MALKEVIAEILSLQPQYTSANSDAMKRRGQLVRQTFPSLLQPLRTELAIAAQLEINDLLIEGRDGVGLKSEVPWVRFSSKSASPSATTGWYVVWLHSGGGEGAFLALAHGSTQFVAGALIARSDEELKRLMAWSRSALAKEILDYPRLTASVQLCTNGPLAASYEKSCVAAFYYPATNIPDDAFLRSDMLAMANLLGSLYEAERLGQTPLSENPEVRDVETATAAIARPSGSVAGQGFSLTAPERRAVELRAMTLAAAHLASLGYTVKDVSARSSFDFEARRGEEVVAVEVKGTTGPGASILLTLNEVELHRRAYPANALILVHSVTLNDTAGFTDQITASGGSLECMQPWALEEDRLRSITFSYRLK